jgi:uncharacterized protein YbbC (DUF1343 family)
VNAAVLYPALGLIEGTNVSVGRGTNAPFEQMGAPWIDGDALARTLNGSKIGGIAFKPATFTPDSSIYKGEACHGVSVSVTDRSDFDPTRAGVVIALALEATYASTWKLDKMAGLLGSQATVDAIRRNDSIDAITHMWDEGLATFRTKRATFLLYR